MLYRATQNGRVMVESFDKIQSTGEENGKPLQYSCLEKPMNIMKRQKDRTQKDELLRCGGAQYVGDQWRNNSRKNEETEKKQKQHPIVVASRVVPHSVGPRFPGPLLIRTRCPDTSPNSTL